jgi:DNA-binding NarL/FixJ family response regulator
VAEHRPDAVSGLGTCSRSAWSDLDELVRALHEVTRGRSALAPQAVEDLMARRSGDASSPLLGLTDREREVLQVMARGATTRPSRSSCS